MTVRFSRTGELFRRRRGDGGTRAVSAEQLEQLRAKEPGYLQRLAWRHTPREIADWDAIIEALSADRDMVFFCDNSFISVSTPSGVWGPLLSRPGRLVLTQRVMAELRPWITRHPEHPLAEAIRDGNPGVTQRLEPEPSGPGHKAFAYYMSLLSLRRRALEFGESIFLEQHGRKPDEAEKRVLVDQVQRDLGSRGRLLATKAPGFFTDEALVYLAVEHALSTGRETIVLTCDADVEEQFFKLLWLINTHYRGHLLANQFVGHELDFETYPVPDELVDDVRGAFEPHDAFIIERHPDMIELLPRGYHFVGISCLNAGTYFTQLSFGAEREMIEVLHVKDKTGGYSTDRLGGRNMYASIHPLITGRGHDCAAVGFDRRKNVGPNGASVSMIDFAQALSPVEQLAHIVPTPEAEMDR